MAIDLAFPRDIDAALGNRKGVTLYNIRDVEQKVQKNISIRTREVTKAEQIIEEEIDGLNEVLERRKHYLQHA